MNTSPTKSAEGRWDRMGFSPSETLAWTGPGWCSDPVAASRMKVAGITAQDAAIFTCAGTDRAGHVLGFKVENGFLSVEDAASLVQREHAKGFAHPETVCEVAVGFVLPLVRENSHDEEKEKLRSLIVEAFPRTEFVLFASASGSVLVHLFAPDSHALPAEGVRIAQEEGWPPTPREEWMRENVRQAGETWEMMQDDEPAACLYFDGYGSDRITPDQGWQLVRDNAQKALAAWGVNLPLQTTPDAAAVLVTQPHGEQSLRLLEPEVRESTGNALFMLRDTKGGEIVMTGEELDSLAEGWLLYRRRHQSVGGPAESAESYALTPEEPGQVPGPSL